MRANTNTLAELNDSIVARARYQFINPKVLILQYLYVFLYTNQMRRRKTYYRLHCADTGKRV